MKPRRWFRFSLRTFFVLVTVFGVWLGVQVKWIHDRHEAIKWLKQQPTDSVGRSDMALAPWSIRLFGEEGVYIIYVRVNQDLVRKERNRLTRLFPEAMVVVKS